MLEARNQRHVLHRALGREGRKQITHHSPVHADIFDFRVLAHPAGQKNVRGCNLDQGSLQRIRVEQVGGYWLQPDHIGFGIASQAVGSPALGEQLTGQIAPNDAAGPHN